MEVSSISKYNRISPKKVRLISGQLSGKQVTFALEALRFMNMKAALMLTKTLKTAQADATHNFKLEAGSLMIKTIDVVGGPSLKRFTPRSRGMGHPILKRSSHIRVVLMEKPVEEPKIEKPKAKAILEKKDTTQREKGETTENNEKTEEKEKAGS